MTRLPWRRGWLPAIRETPESQVGKKARLATEGYLPRCRTPAGVPAMSLFAGLRYGTRAVRVRHLWMFAMFKPVLAKRLQFN